MRTYTRKRPEYQYIEGVNELCRLCLEKCEENVPIFENANVCATLAMRIMICVGLEMAREDCLPNMICIQCYKELEKYYTFRKKCEVSYQKLKSHLHAVRERDVNKVCIENESTIEPVKDLIQSVSEIDPRKLMLTFNEDRVVAVNMLDFNGVVVKDNEDMSVKLEETMDRMENNNKQIQIEVPGQIESLAEENQNPEISDFLSTILTDLGILGKQGDALSVLDPNIKTVTLETGDGGQIHLELIEEDEVKEPEDKDIVIKYITSKYAHSEGKSPIPKMAGNAAMPGSAWCGSCGLWLSSASALSRHKRLHSGERPHQCTVCLRRFAQKEVMLRHRLVHDEVRPFACSSCPKSFTQRGALAVHARSHAPPHKRALALHRCLRCPKVFLYASGLSRHMMMHNGRVYVCGACERHFTDKSSLMRHLNLTNHNHNNTASTQHSPNNTRRSATLDRSPPRVLAYEYESTSST